MVKDKEIRKIINQITEEIKREYQPERIILFGSYAYGEPSSNSDLDLFIIKETDKERRDRFVEVKRLVYDPKRNIVFSPLVYTPAEVEERLSLGDDFVNEILEKGEMLYVR
ncbi:MAG: nucleotidyltransferase domain-containing protein [Nitrospirota bacterium]